MDPRARTLAAIAEWQRRNPDAVTRFLRDNSDNLEETMNNRLPAVIEGGAAVTAWTPERVELLKRTICKGAEDVELELFLARCQQTGLDPFAKQIYAIRRWDGREKREVMSIQVGIDGLRLIADRTGCYLPGRRTEFETDNEGRLVSATAYVRKFAEGEWHETCETAYFDEYRQKGKDGEASGLWGTMPRVMLSKCAESLALRRAFPTQLQGLYTPEEMAQADNPPPLVVDRQTGEVLPSVPRAPAPPSANACTACGKSLTSARVVFSTKQHGRALCLDCERPTVAQEEAAA